MGDSPVDGGMLRFWAQGLYWHQPEELNVTFLMHSSSNSVGKKYCLVFKALKTSPSSSSPPHHILQQVILRVLHLPDTVKSTLCALSHLILTAPLKDRRHYHAVNVGENLGPALE